MVEVVLMFDVKTCDGLVVCVKLVVRQLVSASFAFAGKGARIDRSAFEAEQTSGEVKVVVGMVSVGHEVS